MLSRHSLAKRRVTLTAAAVYAATRGIAYLPAVRPTPAQEPIVAAAGGSEQLVLVYALAWIAAAAFCLVSIRKGRIVAPLATVVGLMGVWGGAWLLGWVQNPATIWWQTAFTYWGPAVMIATLIAMLPAVPTRDGGGHVDG